MSIFTKDGREPGRNSESLLNEFGRVMQELSREAVLPHNAVDVQVISYGPSQPEKDDIYRYAPPESTFGAWLVRVDTWGLCYPILVNVLSLDPGALKDYARTRLLAAHMAFCQRVDEAMVERRP